MAAKVEKTNDHIHHRRPIQGYEVRVRGYLEKTALDWFGEVVINNRPNGDAKLTGSIPDQAALLRVLLYLNNLGLTILEIKAIRRKRA
jgi:hypothetical protein